LRAVIESSELVSADGQSVVWASKVLGDPLPSRVAGIDLMHELLSLAEQRGYRVYILGAKPEVLERALDQIRSWHPRIKLAGAHHGYFDEREDAALAADIAATNADILFVAMSSPRKEYWLGRYGQATGVPFVMGVGGSIDVIAGITRRAPRLLQRLGLEWFYRLLQEPRRLLRRYATTNLRFLLLVAREYVARRLRTAR
jgi:N-acetylglucosaminyldiphosphoundecaprenol N-acetyl-beta-D-mannosaminyltransferase